MADIQIGDRVKYKDRLEWGEGILKSGIHGYYIEFDIPNRTCHTAAGRGRENSCYWVTGTYSCILAIQYTKEELLLNKCKKLWNNSKYVQSNPQKAY